MNNYHTTTNISSLQIINRTYHSTSIYIPQHNNEYRYILFLCLFSFFIFSSFNYNNTNNQKKENGKEKKEIRNRPSRRSIFLSILIDENARTRNSIQWRRADTAKCSSDSRLIFLPFNFNGGVEGWWFIVAWQKGKMDDWDWRKRESSNGRGINVTQKERTDREANERSDTRRDTIRYRNANY